jgi:anthranilate synthase component 2
VLLMIDNYDSFTYNLVQYLQSLGAEVRVERNDALSVDEIERLAPQRIVISPGPCTPNEAGVSMGVIERLGATTPILGVCLGHQSMGQVYGGDVIRAGRIMHGKTSRIRHEGKGVFAGLPDGYEATRYHSLVVDKTRCRIAWKSPPGPTTRTGRWRRSWACATVNSRWKGCSSIRSRS